MPDILKLEEFHLVQLNLKWHESSDEETNEHLVANGQCGLSYDVLRQIDNPRLFALKMRFQFEPQAQPEIVGYEIDAIIDGFFSFPESISEEDMNKLIRINGLTILYGILRGELATVTGLFPGGKFILPAVYVPEIVADIEAKRAKNPKRIKKSARSLSRKS